MAPPARTRSAGDPFADEPYTDDDFDVVEAVRGGRRAWPAAARISLAWLLSGPAPVIGATKLKHIDDAVAASSVELSADECARMEAPYRPHEILPKP